MTIHASPTSQRGVDDIGATVQITDVAALPLAPKNPLPYRQRLRALRVFHIGQETVRDAGGPVTLPGWMRGYYVRGVSVHTPWVVVEPDGSVTVP